MRETLARANFVASVQQIYSFAISTEVSKGGALKMGYTAKLSHESRDDHREIFMRKLRKHCDEVRPLKSAPPADALACSSICLLLHHHTYYTHPSSLTSLTPPSPLPHPSLTPPSFLTPTLTPRYYTAKAQTRT